MARRHIHRLRVAFVDCDPAQIVHFSNYFRWFDTASREFFTACGVPSWRDTERDSGIIGTPLVDAQASFRNPATYGEDYRPDAQQLLAAFDAVEALTATGDALAVSTPGYGCGAESLFKMCVGNQIGIELAEDGTATPTAIPCPVPS